MGLPTVRRRVAKLETVFAPDRFADFPPFSPEEIEGLLGRLGNPSKRWSFEEEARVARQCPIAQGEFLVSARGSNVSVKRYLGVDLAEI
jgi:hypothetical protein